jgi:hypothetical protein
MKEVRAADGLGSINDNNGTPTSKILVAFFAVISMLSNILGMWPIQYDKVHKTLTFKILSCKSLVSLFCLIFFNLPFMVLPLISLYGGFVMDEFQQRASDNGTVRLQNSTVDYYTTQMIVWSMENFSNYSLFILPFAVSPIVTKPLEMIFKIATSQKNQQLSNKLNGKILVFPMIGFVFFVIGKSLVALEMVLYAGGLPLTTFTFVSYFVFSSLGLQFWLAVQEFWVYYVFNWHGAFVRKLLDTRGQENLLMDTVELLTIMENMHKATGILLLVDLSLMLFYWLIHLYSAYVYLQYSYMIAFFGSVLTVLAELSRVALLSCTCGKFTERTEEVIMRLRETWATTENETERRVGYFSHLISRPASAVIYRQAGEEQCGLGLRILYGGPGAGHLFPRRHFHLLGHPRPVHSDTADQQLNYFSDFTV